MKKLYALLLLTFVVTGLKAQVFTNDPQICMVTVDDSSRHNLVYYDKTQYAAVDSFILWRENNITPGSYDRILGQDSAAFSMFIDMDTAGNPNIKLHRYKLQAWQHVAGYSNMGPYHTVLYCLQQDSNYNWNQYDVEGQGTGWVNNYVVLQDDNSTGAWHPVDTVSGAWSSWVDGAVTLYPNGQWRLATLWSVICSPTARYSNNQAQTTIIKSKSNITNNRTTGINDSKASSAVLYPNPATENVTLRMNFPVSQETTVRVMNALGLEVYSAVLAFGKDELRIPLSGLPKGIYFTEISNKQSKVVKRLVVE